MDSDRRELQALHDRRHLRLESERRPGKQATVVIDAEGANAQDLFEGDGQKDLRGLADEVRSSRARVLDQLVEAVGQAALVGALRGLHLVGRYEHILSLVESLQGKF